MYYLNDCYIKKSGYGVGLSPLWETRKAFWADKENYQSNVKSYPKWLKWLKKHQPELLVIWGKYDPSFTVDGVWKYKDDVPKAEVHIVDGGHFALDEAEPEILILMQQFLKKVTTEK